MEAWDFLRERGSVEAWGARLVSSFEISLGPFENLFSFLRSPVLSVLSSSLWENVKDFQSRSPDVPFCVSKAMLLRAKRYAFGVRKVTF